MIRKQPDEDTAYYTDADIARLLGISLGRLRNKLSGGCPLPPRIQPPGCRHRLWRREAVQAWLEQFSVTGNGDARGQRILGRVSRRINKDARVRR